MSTWKRDAGFQASISIFYTTMLVILRSKKTKGANGRTIQPIKNMQKKNDKYILSRYGLIVNIKRDEPDGRFA